MKHALLFAMSTMALALPFAGQSVGLAPGSVLLDLELPTIDRQETIRLSELRGRKLLLIQFASW